MSYYINVATCYIISLDRERTRFFKKVSLVNKIVVVAVIIYHTHYQTMVYRGETRRPNWALWHHQVHSGSLASHESCPPSASRSSRGLSAAEPTPRTISGRGTPRVPGPGPAKSEDLLVWETSLLTAAAFTVTVQLCEDEMLTSTRNHQQTCFTRSISPVWIFNFSSKTAATSRKPKVFASWTQRDNML